MDNKTLEDHEGEIEEILEWRINTYFMSEEYKVKWKGKLVITCLKSQLEI